MAKTFSIDIVSDYDISEVDHAVDQTRREIVNRYDLKGTAAKIEYIDDLKQGVVVTGDNDYHLTAIVDMLRQKLAKRSVSQKVLDTSQSPQQSGMKVVQNVLFKKGLDQPKAKDLSKKIRDWCPKAKVQIQGDLLRVSSSSKDDLQDIMHRLKELDLDYPLSFTNFR